LCEREFGSTRSILGSLLRISVRERGVVGVGGETGGKEPTRET